MHYGLRMLVSDLFAVSSFYRTEVFNVIMSKQKEKVFYAVGVGRKVGVYQTWNDCKKQVEGVANPKFRKFTTFEEAVKFVSKYRNKDNQADDSIVSSQQSSSAFSSRSSDSYDRSREEHHKQETKGELPEGINANNSLVCNTVERTEEGGNASEVVFLRDKVENCERKVDLCVGKIGEILSCLTDLKNELRQLKLVLPRNCVALPKEIDDGSFDSKISTSAISSVGGVAWSSDTGDDKEWNHEQPDYQRSQRVKEEVNVSDENERSQATPAKRKRTWADSCSSSSQERKLHRETNEGSGDHVSFTIDEDDYVVVYTDGSCMHNGTINAKAGIGIWFDDGHPLNVSKPLRGAEPTNNNAEIQAARIACELALSAGIKKLKICTDSEFLINCITKWVHRWKSNGWLTGANVPVKNRVELEKLLDVISRLSVRWEKVAGHSDIKGNEMADRLANKGAEYYVKES